jgi:hypothetical protein
MKWHNILKTSNLVAHRGFWKDPEEKNTLKAISYAFDNGFSVETDLRDASYDIVISHDPPLLSNCVTFSDLLEVYKAKKIGNSQLALNVKSDGIDVLIQKELKKHGITDQDYYLFDMSVPDMINYVNSNSIIYTRYSEYEDCSFLSSCSGVWVDNFTGVANQIGIAEKILEQGLKAVIVSSELHGRDYKVLWTELLSSGLTDSENLSICTDFPMEAKTFFGINQ